MGSIKYNENAINLMKHAHSMGISKGMEVYMSWLSEKRQHVTYIPKNEDNTYIVQSASALRNAYPKPKSANYIKRRDYDTITLLLLRYAAKHLDDFAVDKIPELEKTLEEELENRSMSERVDILCRKITSIAKDNFLEEVETLEKDADDRSRDALIKFAEKNNLVSQEKFYKDKFVERLDKTPEVSAFYSNLVGDEREQYAETCYDTLYFKSNGYTTMTMSEAFNDMFDHPEIFEEIDKDYEETYDFHPEEEEENEL